MHNTRVRSGCTGAMMALFLLGGAAFGARADGAGGKALDYLGRGDAAYRSGDLVEATKLWGETAEYCRLNGDQDHEAEALAKRGEALEALGQFRRAIDDLGQAAATATSAGDETQLAAAAGALGNIYFQTKDIDRARPLLEQSLEIAQRKNLPSIVAASENNLGNLLAATGDPAGARDAYRGAVKAATAAGDMPLLVTAETNEGRLVLKAGNTDPATAMFRGALDRALTLPPSRDATYALLAIGEAAKPARGETTRETQASLAARQAVAYRALQAAAQRAEDQRDSRAASLGWGYLAELYETARRDADARRLGDRAIILAQRTDAADLLYQWEWLEGRLAHKAGDGDAAIAAYRLAVADLEKVRAEIPVQYVDGRSSFRETVGPLYFELADLLLQKSSSMGQSAQAQPILIEARNTVETLKAAEIRDYFKEECLAAPEAKSAQVQSSAAGSQTAALYPILLPDRVELLVSFSDGVQQFTSRVDQKSLTDTVERMRTALETLGKREYFAPGQQLYDWLIRPLEPALAAHHIDTLVIVPDGILRTIPFAALYDGKTFLVQKYALATAPSLTLIDAAPVAREANPRVLLAGLSEGVQGYSPLRNVPQELASIDKVFPATVIQNQGFSSATIERDLKAVPYSVVHIASHGEFDSNPEKTYILTYDGKLTLDNLEDALKYSEYRQQPLELLTLSACRTAAGDDRAALGLAGVAIKAGARSAVASLWFISDAASTHLVELFYADLGKGMTKAKAMQQAQLDMIGDPLFRHPGYWSPFLVIGNWL
jgi:CHAT domain-containing protein